MNPNDLNERKLQILQAIIADFISTGEPVGSRSLSKSHDMGISPATIRNEMSDLEEMGYLTHPHTSAGRVPSDRRTACTWTNSWTRASWTRPISRRSARS